MDAPATSTSDAAQSRAFADFRTITNVVPALISFFDADHVCRFANDHHREWYGREPEELRGRHMREFLGEEGYERRRPYLERVERGEVVAFDAEVPHRLVGQIDASLRYVPRMSADGKFEGFYILVFDTARHQFRFRSIFDAMAVSFWELDFSGVALMLKRLRDKGVTDFRAHATAHPEFVRQAINATITIDVNDKSVELFEAATKEELLGSVGPFWPRESEQVYAESLFASLERQPHFEAETRFVTLNGRLFEALFTCAFPRGAGKRPTFTVGIVDISARVAAQGQLATVREELAHAARVATLGELTASIAHEVNQPLAAIVTNGEAAKRWLGRAEPDLDEAGKAIDRMISEGVRASSIISRIRAMAQKGGPDRSSFALDAMIEDAVEIVRHELARHRVRVLLDPALDIKVVADRVQLQQVIINLMVNAAQAMDQVPEAERDLKVVTGRSDGDYVIEVSDTGPGLEEDQAAQLFNAFYTTKADGMGMGLSIARTIVEAHGGRIEAGNGPNGGALFRILIPLDEAADRA